MIEALIDGERRGQVLADLAKGRMRSKIPDMSMALEGRFGKHHAVMCRLHLEHIGHLEAMIAELEARIEAMMQPFRAARDLLVTIPGIGPLSAAAVKGYLKSLYHRHVTRNGGYRSAAAKNKAIVTVAHAILVIIWTMLTTGRPYDDLGPDYFDRRTDPDREARRLIARLEALGRHVTLDNAA
jgi:transposase